MYSKVRIAYSCDKHNDGESRLQILEKGWTNVQLTVTESVFIQQYFWQWKDYLVILERGVCGGVGGNPQNLAVCLAKAKIFPGTDFRLHKIFRFDWLVSEMKADHRLIMCLICLSMKPCLLLLHNMYQYWLLVEMKNAERWTLFWSILFTFLYMWLYIDQKYLLRMLNSLFENALVVWEWLAMISLNCTLV